ncbi:MAG: flagellar hook-length control protein FliK, partial [Candidatus Eremiobacteraeota bacterium]|nr:flagellar hook-length control protein FliK [Candidatus Eremiobacteraeota bacterium]
LKLSVTGGTVNASIVAQNADVRQTLLANQQQLAASLADAGLSLGAFSVDVSGGNPDGRTAQQFQQFGKKSFSHAIVDDVDATETTEPKLGPSILNRPTDPWLLNYFA